MTQLPDYFETALELFSDADYSKVPKLRDLNRGTMLAAAELLHTAKTPMTEDSLLVAAWSFHLFAQDDGHLCDAVEPEFMDQCDERKFSAGLFDRIHSELAAKIIRDFQARDWYVVRLREMRGHRPSEAGYYIFDAAAVPSL